MYGWFEVNKDEFNRKELGFQDDSNKEREIKKYLLKEKMNK